MTPTLKAQSGTLELSTKIPLAFIFPRNLVLSPIWYHVTVTAEMVVVTWLRGGELLGRLGWRKTALS